jgi:hypothetical protein
MTEPLPPDVRDALLNADLDGELAGAAADHELTEEEARERLAATPGAARRRRELEVATRELAVPPLSEHESRRLVRTAAAAAQPVPARRWPGRVPWGAAAAVLALLAGAGVVTSIVAGNDRGGDRATGALTRAADSGAESATGSRSLPVEEFGGDVSDPAVLRGLISDAEAARQRSADSDGSDYTTSGKSSATSGRSPAPAMGPTADRSGDLSAQAATGVDRCIAAFRQQYRAEPVALYHATDRDRPVLVAVFRSDTSTAAAVLALSDCSPIGFAAVRN